MAFQLKIKEKFRENNRLSPMDAQAHLTHFILTEFPYLFYKLTEVGLDKVEVIVSGPPPRGMGCSQLSLLSAYTFHLISKSLK